MTNIISIFASMKYLNYLFRFIVITIIVLPVWILMCFTGLIVSIIIHFFVQIGIVKQIKYRNNMKSIINDFKQDITQFFIFY